jgi:hypothetical protein
MVAYSFQKRFVSHVVAGLEPGPWLPGMKRHTLRAPRAGRQGHAAPGQPVHLYTAMRTKHCRGLGIGVCRLTMPVTLTWREGALGIRRADSLGRYSGRFAPLAPIVSELAESRAGEELRGVKMDEFARTDGFADAADMAAFFDPPPETSHVDLVLIAWTPREDA